MTTKADNTQPSETNVDFSMYSQGDYRPGRRLLVRCLWAVCSLLFFEHGWCPFSGWKVFVLRCFGAKIGQHVVIKPNVRIKFPWRLRTGDHVWIGQEVWIDNLAEVNLGSHVCLSQRVYLCTGSHDHRKSSFDLITEPITVDSGGWVCAGVILLPGTLIGRDAIVSAGSVVQGDVEPAAIVKGNPAIKVAERKMEEINYSRQNDENRSESSD